MIVWRELAEGDAITIHRESGKVVVAFARPGHKPRVETIDVREVRCATHDVVVTAARRLMQRAQQ